MLELTAGDAHVEIDPESGGRLAQIRVGGNDLLVDRGSPHHNHPFGWGSYPMAPFAGRIRRGRFAFAGREYELPPNLGGHAIHGVALEAPWTVEFADRSSARLACGFAPPWPFGGRVVHEIDLTSERLEQRLTVEADRPMPVTVGWHPWWRRDIGSGSRLELSFDDRPARMFRRDDDMMPTGDLTPPGPHPWDDCFTGIGTVTVRWPDALEIDIEHDCGYVVIYEPDHAVCVEPQTGPPDAWRHRPHTSLAEPGRPITATTTWRWRVLRGAGHRGTATPSGRRRQP